MVRGLYTAAAGMIVQNERIDIIANNLANVNTTSYKQD
ncbi:MAG TPA: flagellar basal body protein, partial [Exilispira sp.]|nr:flagellar basal body protein [Exilispira sp.]